MAASIRRTGRTGTLHSAAVAATLALLVREAACAAADDGPAVAQAMREARTSGGFEMRLALGLGLRSEASAPAASAGRVALVGQAGPEGERLLVHGLGSEPAGSGLLLEESADGRVCARVVRGASPPPAAEAHAGILGTGLVAWDLLAPWWRWPDQRLDGSDVVNGHACTRVRSRPAGRGGEVGEVRSCVDAAQGLAWRTIILDRHGRILRVAEVTRAMRTQAGTSVARNGTVADTEGRLTHVEMYAGDEHHRIAPGFLDAVDGAGRANAAACGAGP